MLRSHVNAKTAIAMNDKILDRRAGRIVHITHRKCGSQWVKDVLTAPEIVRHTNMPYSGVTFDVALEDQPIPASCVSGPIYNMGQGVWAQWRRREDRAVVVIRDPRDATVSSMYSWLYSHGTDIQVEAVRNLLASLPRDEERLVCTIREFGSGARAFRTWINPPDSSALVMKYETLIHDQISGFKKIFDWLEWDIPRATLCAVVERMDFKKRSGRIPGVVDIYSHLRKGVAGDWRRHFSKQAGRLWEALYPGLLRAADYEASDDWWQALPEQVEPFLSADDIGRTDAHLAEARKRRNEFLEGEVIEKERVIRELSEECRKRLDVIDAQAAQIEALSVENKNELLEQEVREKESVIRELSEECRKRLDVIDAQAAQIEALSYKDKEEH